MREIKFRAWNGYSMYSPTIEGTYNISVFLSEIENLMQYTGLKDKNGVEIYEGDIVEISKTRGEITYNKFLTGFVFCEEEGEELLSNFSYSAVVVLGNIHENPELPRED